MFESHWDDEKSFKDVTYDDESTNGLTEYGYGLWLRYAWNGPSKLINKSSYSYIARVSGNSNFGGFNRNYRSLSLWLGSPFYHFCTYIPGNSNYYSNVEYNQMLDGQWNYIYFSYK